LTGRSNAQLFGRSIVGVTVSRSRNNRLMTFSKNPALLRCRVFAQIGIIIACRRQPTEQRNLSRAHRCRSSAQIQFVDRAQHIPILADCVRVRVCTVNVVYLLAIICGNFLPMPAPSRVNILPLLTPCTTVIIIHTELSRH